MSNQILSRRKSLFPLKLSGKHATNLHLWLLLYVTKFYWLFKSFPDFLFWKEMQMYSSFNYNHSETPGIDKWFIQQEWWTICQYFHICTESNWAPVMKASQSKNALMINAQNPLIFVILFLSLDLCRHVLMKTIKHKQISSAVLNPTFNLRGNRTT